VAPRWAAVLLGIAAGLAVYRDLLMVHLSTAVHEGGHALMGWLSGRRVRGVWLARAEDSYTVSAGRPRGLGLCLTLVAGYVSPPLAGLLLADLLAAGKLASAFILGLVALLALLILNQTRFGEVVIISTGTLLVLTVLYAPTWAQTAVAYFLAWALLFHGPKDVLLLHRIRRAGGQGSDADGLGSLTHTPALVWVVLFGAFSLWCALKGAVLLLR
jgi:hypothetical protein